MTVDTDYWTKRLAEVAARHDVPGASLAVLSGGRIHRAAAGVLRRDTGAAVTPRALFQVGSITKVFTATLVMRLVETGELDLDARIVDVLPGFALSDATATDSVTVRQLLSHTSGVSGDFMLDTGRGDDCLARYVDACARVGQDFAPGAGFSYSSTGYNILGRVVERATGQSWDEALRRHVLEPLGLNATATLPEEVLGHPAAMSHLPGEDGRARCAARWNPLPRSSGPSGGVMCATASDLVRFAAAHLGEGELDGVRLLRSDTVAAMRRRQADTVDAWSVRSVGWGLGWSLYDWNGAIGFGHDGATIGQYAFVNAFPEAGVAVALLTNGGDAGKFASAVLREVLDTVAGVRMPADFAPPSAPVTVDIAPVLGRYRREGAVMDVTERAEKVHMRLEFVDGMAGMSPPWEFELRPVRPGVFAAPAEQATSTGWMPVVFTTLADGGRGVSFGMRTAPKVD